MDQVDPVFSGKVLIMQKEFLVRCPADIRQYALQIHNNSHGPLVAIFLV